MQIVNVIPLKYQCKCKCSTNVNVLQFSCKKLHLFHSKHENCGIFIPYGEMKKEWYRNNIKRSNSKLSNEYYFRTSIEYYSRTEK